jgi:hypothetical protein
MKKNQRKRKYDSKIKKDCISYAFNYGPTLAAKKFQININTIATWMYVAGGRKNSLLNNGRVGSEYIDPRDEEIRALKKFLNTHLPRK